MVRNYLHVELPMIGSTTDGPEMLQCGPREELERLLEVGALSLLSLEELLRCNAWAAQYSFLT
jgi:hypothetical protein